MSIFSRFFKRRRYEDLSVSIREHLESRVEELMDAGMSREQAGRASRREFGNVALIEERGREAWQWPTLESMLADMRFSFRQFRKSPGFTAVVVIILALGIGANATVFSVVDAVMLRPLPYVQPERLVEVKSSEWQHYETGDVSYPDYFDWRAQNRSFEQLLSYHDSSLTLTGVARPLRLDGEVASWNLLPTLGIAPQLGRGFTQEEEKRGSRVILISDSLWRTQFAGDRSVVGRTVSLSGISYTIVGVMPASFRFPVTSPTNSFWTTLAADDDPTDPHPVLQNRGVHFLTVMGRLKPGVTVAQASEEMNAIAGRLGKQYPDTNTKHSAAEVETELGALLGDTSKLLMIDAGRGGAGAADCLRQHCQPAAGADARAAAGDCHAMRAGRGTGAGDTAVAGGEPAAGSGGRIGGMRSGLCTDTGAAAADWRQRASRAADAGVNLPVLGFALVVSLLSSAIFGIIPAVTASKTDLVANLKEGGRSDTGGRGLAALGFLVVAQVTLGIVLTCGAALLTASFVHESQVDEGFNQDHLLTYGFELPDSAYPKTRPQFYRQYFEKLRALPGVVSAGGAHNLPMTDDLAMISFENPERPIPSRQLPNVDLTIVISDGYFKTLQTPLLQGRDFSEADDMTAPQVMMVNQAFVQQYFPGEPVLGKKLKSGAGNGTPGGPPWRTIIGVVGNIRHFAYQQEMPAQMYLPASQMPTWCCLHTVVRTSVDPMSLEPEARQLVLSMDPDVPVTEVRTMPELQSLQLAQPRFAMILLGAFAALALILTVVGLYGVMAYSVSRRTREIGVRLALGAPRSAVLKMVLWDAAVLLMMGIGIGVAASLASASVLKSMLYGTAPRDPLVLAVVCASVALAGLMAAYIPAFRAASIDPTRALRSE